MKFRVLALPAIVLVCVAAVSSSVVPKASAQDSRACLQNNKIWSWNVINDRTLVVTDMYYRPFLVRLTGGCVGLTNANYQIQFGTWMSLSCLGRGDRVSFVDQALGPMTCSVTQVQPYVPGANGRNYAPRGGAVLDRN